MDSLYALNPELHIMAVDLRGHGRNRMPDSSACAAVPEGCFRPADFAADFAVFMRVKGISKGDLAVHSLGSFIVQ